MRISRKPHPIIVNYLVLFSVAFVIFFSGICCFFSVVFFFFSGANPNIQTIETAEHKTKSAARRTARQEAKCEARKKAIALEKEIDEKKIMERTREEEEIQKRTKRGSTSSKKEADESYRSDSFEADLGKKIALLGWGGTEG